MAADIGEGADFPVAATHEDDGFAAQFKQEITPRFGQPAGVAGINPVAKENLREVFFIDRPVGVKTGIQRKPGAIAGNQLRRARWRVWRRKRRGWRLARFGMLANGNLGWVTFSSGLAQARARRACTGKI